MAFIIDDALIIAAKAAMVAAKVGAKAAATAAKVAAKGVTVASKAALKGTKSAIKGAKTALKGVETVKDLPGKMVGSIVDKSKVLTKAKDIVQKPGKMMDNIVMKGLEKMGFDKTNPDHMKMYSKIKSKAADMTTDTAQSILSKASQGTPQQGDSYQPALSGMADVGDTEGITPMEPSVIADAQAPDTSARNSASLKAVITGLTGLPLLSPGNQGDAIKESATADSSLGNAIAEQDVSRSALSDAVGNNVDEDMIQQALNQGGVMGEGKEKQSMIDKYISSEESDNKESKLKKTGRIAAQVGLKTGQIGANLIESATGLNVGLDTLLGEGATALAKRHKENVEIDQQQNLLASFLDRNRSGIDTLIAKDLMQRVKDGESFDDAIKGSKAARDYVYGEKKAPLEQRKLEAEVEEKEMTIEERVAAARPMKEMEADVSAQSQAKTQELKRQEAASSSYLRAQGAVQTTMDQYYDFGSAQIEKFGLTPGDFLGLADKLTPKQWNEHKAKFQGAGIEGAAQVARLAIPGARGLNMIGIFALSGAEVGNTTEGNIENTVATMRSNLDKAISDNMYVMNEDTGKMESIRDNLIDEKTGKKLSELSINELIRAKRDIGDKFQKENRRTEMIRAFKKNPRLFKSDKIRAEAGAYVQEELNQKDNEISAQLAQIDAQLGGAQ